MKENLGVWFLAAMLAGCQSVPPPAATTDANSGGITGIVVEQGGRGLSVVDIRRDVTCPAHCQVTVTPNIVVPDVYDGSGMEGPPPGWPGSPDYPGESPTPPHDVAPDGYKFCELYVLMGDLYMCGEPPRCPGPIFSPKYQRFLELTAVSYGTPCRMALFKPHVVKPVPELTLVAGTKFVPPSTPPPILDPPPPPPPYPRATLQVGERILNAGLVTVDFPQTLRVDDDGYLVGSLALFSAPTKINVAIRGSNPKGSVVLRFTINLVPAGEEVGL